MVISSTSVFFSLFLCEVVKRWFSESGKLKVHNSRNHDFAQELKEEHTSARDQCENFTWARLYREVLVNKISLWSVLSSLRYSKKRRDQLFDDFVKIRPFFRSIKSRQRLIQFRFYKFQKNSYYLEKKYEKFQLNKCISWKFIQKTKCIGTFSTHCAILHEVISARVNFQLGFQARVNLILTSDGTTV